MHVLIDIDLFTYCNSLEFHSNKVHMLERCREDDSIQLRKKKTYLWQLSLSDFDLNPMFHVQL